MRGAFVIASCVLAALLSLACAQGQADHMIPPSAADGVPDAEVVEPRVSIIEFIRASEKHQVFNRLLPLEGTDSELGSILRRNTVFAPTDTAWAAYARQITRPIRPRIKVDPKNPSSVIDALGLGWQQIARIGPNELPDAERTVRYQIVPDAVTYQDLLAEGERSTLAGLALKFTEDEILDLNPSYNVSRPKKQFLLTNGWVLVTNKVLVPFDLEDVIAKVAGLPRVTPTVSAATPAAVPSPSPVGASPSAAPSVSVLPSASPGAPGVPSTGPSPGGGIGDDNGDDDDDVDGSPGATDDDDDTDSSFGPGGSDDEEPEEDDPVCFPGSAQVQQADGTYIKMEEISGGSQIVHNEAGESSAVFLFTHRQARVERVYRRLKTACGQSLTLSANHYMYANDRLTAAGAVRVGDSVRTVSGACVVTEVTAEKMVGVYAPHTMHGDLVVDGVVVSGYSRAVSPRVAHTLLAPVRWAARTLGLREPLGNALYDGADWALHALPRGLDRY